MKKPTCRTSSTMIYQHCLDRGVLNCPSMSQVQRRCMKTYRCLYRGILMQLLSLVDWTSMYKLHSGKPPRLQGQILLLSHQSSQNCPSHNSWHKFDKVIYDPFLDFHYTHFCIFPLPLHWPNSSRNCLVVWAKRLFILFGKRGLVNLFVEDTEIKTEQKKTCCTLKQQPIF